MGTLKENLLGQKITISTTTMQVELTVCRPIPPRGASTRSRPPRLCGRADECYPAIAALLSGDRIL